MRNLKWKQSALAVGLMAAGVVWADYVIVDLGTLGGNTSAAYGINNSAVAAGQARTASSAEHAFLNNGSMVDIHSYLSSYERSAAESINDNNQVTGFYRAVISGPNRAFMYDNGVVTDLGTLGGVNSHGIGINSAGDVAGQASLASGISHAFLYSGGVMTDLGTLGGTYSTAYAINDSSDVVGVADLAGSAVSHAFLYSGGVMTDLGALGTGLYSVAQDVNNSGVVVGSSYTSGYATQHAFIYSGGVMTDLGALGGTQSIARAINNNGDVVGQYYPGASGVVRAFLYSGGTMQDLNSLLPAGSGWTLLFATDINDYGQIVGVGQIDGNQRAFLMSPGC
jgi:probable HAF family extracellular repeat protein